jgi:hypothetical protein
MQLRGVWVEEFGAGAKKERIAIAVARISWARYHLPGEVPQAETLGHLRPAFARPR